jgi:hypothetical protein
MPAWKDYQEEAAEFFRSLGLEAETNVTVKARLAVRFACPTAVREEQP